MLLHFLATFQDIEREIDAVEMPRNGKGVTKPGKYVHLASQYLA